jgi:large subunit ribosomal protein L19
MVTVKDVERMNMKSTLPKFRVGDTVEVLVKIVEGDKERTQVFRGTVIAHRGQGMVETFTVRRIVGGEGVERLFPIHSPAVQDVRVIREGHVRRAKLYYLRERTGKATRVKARRPISQTEEVVVEGEVEPKEAKS